MDVSGSKSTSVNSCKSKPNALAVFPYTKLNSDRNGSAVNLEVHVSSWDGNCTAMIYSSQEFGYTMALGDVQDRCESAIVLR